MDGSIDAAASALVLDTTIQEQRLKRADITPAAFLTPDLITRASDTGAILVGCGTALMRDCTNEYARASADDLLEASTNCMSWYVSLVALLL